MSVLSRLQKRFSYPLLSGQSVGRILRRSLLLLLAGIAAGVSLLLRWLTGSDLTGWDLVVTAQQRVGDFWSLTQSQVYRELAAMDAEYSQNHEKLAAAIFDKMIGE